MSEKTSEPDQSSSSTSREAFAAAVAARVAQAQDAALQKTAKQLAAEHEGKQSFRRLIDPGIFRPNSRENTIEALKTLKLLSDNVLREPRNPKYASFKPTNSTIKRKLVDIKGAIELAVALGFHSVTQNYQPSYAFNPKHLEDMRIGNEMIAERLALEEERDKRATVHKETEKERKEEVARKVQLAYAEDRKSKAEFDEREARLREARAARPPEPPQAKVTRKSKMPSAGVTLGGQEVDVAGAQTAGAGGNEDEEEFDDEEDEE